MPISISEIVSLTEEWVDEAGEVLADAFHDYPLTRYLFEGSGARYHVELRSSFRLDCLYRVELGWPFLGALADGKLVGVALVVGLNRSPEDTALHKMESSLLASFEAQTATRLREYGDMKARHKPRRRHMYLESIGVLAGHRGEGHAGRLLRRVHQISETTPRSAGVGLDTQLPGNLPLYQHFGYEVTDETSMGNVPVWFMFRPNQERPGDNTGAAGAGR